MPPPDDSNPSSADQALKPRNLTAIAQERLSGNPPTSTPESGTDNCHPGLEMDIRQLDRVFFEGLRFDFAYRIGAKLGKVFDQTWLNQPGWTTQDQEAVNDGGFFLWYVKGCFGSAPRQVSIFDAWGQDGYTLMGRLPDLEPGELTIVVGHPKPEGRDDTPAAVAWLTARDEARTALEAGMPPQLSVSSGRSNLQVLSWIMFRGQRNTYLDDHGVINHFGQDQALEPGTLTQSLCSPWQWDFADCGCYYWAASRPDIVTAADGGSQSRNYQRDLSGLDPTDPANWKSWMASTVTLPQMLSQWQRLPLVIREQEHPGRDVKPGPGASTDPVLPLWPYAKVIEQLKYLATVEHALVVQYLYAYYSINHPPLPNSGLNSDEAALLARCAGDIRRLAMDEMQHWQWVNEALALLKEEPQWGRAPYFGLLPQGEVMQAPPRPFELQPLTDELLDTLIELEMPHQTGSQYRLILMSLDAATNIPASQRHRLKELIKLLIDEGGDHVRQLLAVKSALKNLQSARLRITSPPTFVEPNLQEQGDMLYAQLLGALKREFGVSPQLGESMGFMKALHAVANQSAAMGCGLRFTMPKP